MHTIEIFEFISKISFIFLPPTEYHTIALIVPAILGIFQYFLGGSYVPYFCAFYVIWMMVCKLTLINCLIS